MILPIDKAYVISYDLSMIDTSSITASEAREDLYNIIRKASLGLKAFEIKLRGASPVVLISKEELEGWLETLDIMASPEEARAIEEGKRDKTAVSLETLIKKLEVEEKSKHGNSQSNSQKKSRKRV